MVFPRFHFGPFDEVGSSSFIHYVDKGLELSVKTFTFHTAGSHEHNLVSSKDAVSIAGRVANDIRDSLSNAHKDSLCRPLRIKMNDGWEAFTISVKDFLAAIISNNERGNDDIPHQTWDMLRSISDPHLEVMIVDAHSRKGNKVTDPTC